MAEYAFNPDTGSGEQVTRGGGGQAPSSLQEQANLHQDIAFRNTAQHLTERAAKRDGYDPTEVGGGDIEAELKLQAVQKELYDRNSGKLPHDPLKMLQLEALQNTLANSLIGGQEEVTQSREEQQKQDGTELLTETAEGLASDPIVQQTLQWASQEFSDETNGVFNEVTDKITDPVKLQKSTQILKSIKENPESYSTADEVGTLSPQTNQWFASEFSPEIANQITTINAALARGVTTRADAMRLVIKSPGLLEAVLSASQNPDVDFTLAL